MRIGLAGIGTVGSALVGLLQAQEETYSERAGQELRLTAVSARNKLRDRDCDLSDVAWVEDARALATRDDVDVVVEAIGGAEGVARELAEAALANGKHYVTANKALIAAHGRDLAVQAEKAGLQLAFEAAVCGGMPILKTLCEGMAAERVESLRGILNGTTNYILSRMAAEGADFAAVLADAQRLGYAEADPSADVDGFDAANKLAILAALAFGVTPNVEAIFVEGIRAVTASDLRDAKAKGGTIKLVGAAQPKPADENGPARLVLRVQPMFVPASDLLSRVDGVMNAVQIEGTFNEETTMIGFGAGGHETATALIADLIDLARGHRTYAFGIPAAQLAELA